VRVLLVAPLVDQCGQKSFVIGEDSPWLQQWLPGRANQSDRASIEVNLVELKSSMNARTDGSRQRKQ
jgi:hypothetical protein